MKSDGGELYIPSPNAHGLIVVDTWTNDVAGYVMLGSSPDEAVLSPDGQLLYVSDAGASQIVPVQIGARQVLQPITTGQEPGVLEFASVGDTLLAVNSGSDQLAVIRTEGCSQASGSPAGCLIALVPVGRSPSGLAVKEF